MLVGGAFTDAPRCTDPLLAELARMVNDNIGERARSSLIGLAPGLVGLPRMPSAAAPAVVAAALDVALRECPDRKELLRHRRRVLRQASAGVDRPALLDDLRRAFYRYGPARHALACAVHVVSEHSESEAARDRALTAMLGDAMAAGGLRLTADCRA
jgi:hypothetical protein